MDNIYNNNYLETNSLKNNITETMSNVVHELQNTFLNTNLGSAIKSGLDVGIRAIFPDFIENEIINLKDNIINNGFKEGLNETMNEVINIGKNAIGVITGNFENISQAQEALKKGGFIDKISDLLDIAVTGLKNAGIIDSNLAKEIKKGKKYILNNVQKSIESSFSNQTEDMNKLENYINNWKEKFKQEDFNGMEKEFNKMKNKIKSLLPIENTLNEYRTIENLQELIKNNGKDFNLTEEQLELVQKLF